MTYYVLVVIELSTRRVQVAGITLEPDRAFMMQVGRNHTDLFDGFLLAKHFLIMDREKKYTETFRHILTNSGTRIVRLPANSPNLNAYAERFIFSIKSECLDRMIFFGEQSLRRTITAYLTHYHRERNHQSLDNGLIELEESVEARTNEVCCREWLGGILHYYYRPAA